MRASLFKNYGFTGLTFALQRYNDFAPYFRTLVIVTVLLSVWAGLRAA